MSDSPQKIRDLSDSRTVMQKALEGLFEETQEVSGDIYFIVPPSKFHEACMNVCLQNGPKFDYIRCYTAIHREGKIELLLHLFSTKTFLKGMIKTVLPDDQPEIESVREIIPGANWYEREIHEMYGVGFSGLPDDDKLLLAEDIEGYPLRKDFKDDRPDWMLENREDLMIAPTVWESFRHE